MTLLSDQNGAVVLVECPLSGPLVFVVGPVPPRMPVPLEGSRVSNRNAASYTLPIRLSADTRQTSTVQFLWTNLSFGDFVALPFQNSPAPPSCVLSPTKRQDSPQDPRHTAGCSRLARECPQSSHTSTCTSNFSSNLLRTSHGRRNTSRVTTG